MDSSNFVYEIYEYCPVVGNNNTCTCKRYNAMTIALPFVIEFSPFLLLNSSRNFFVIIGTKITQMHDCVRLKKIFG